jgi:hypothetical protein
LARKAKLRNRGLITISSELVVPELVVKVFVFTEAGISKAN